MAVAYRILVGFTILVTFVECQIISSLDPQITACVGEDVDLDWVYGDATNFLSVTWTYIDSQSTQTVIMQQNIGGSAAPVGGFNVVHKTNGGITLTGVNKTNSGSYKISVTYISATASDDDTVAVTVNDCSTTTTTTSTITTTTTPPASTTTTSPASTTTTSPASTTTTSPASTTTSPASTTATPASTTTMSASTTTTMSTTTTTSTTTATTTPTTTTSSLTTRTTPVTTPSTTSLSDKMIIVIVVVPVGVIAVVGTIIFFYLFYRLRRGERKPTNHKRHKHGKHYKGNMRPVQQHQQQTYILYGRGHTRESNHKETKRSRSLHDDRYNWFDGYHWGSRVKRTPVYKDDRNLSRLYNNETLPRNDDYRSGYTTGHVYPSHISSYQYRPEYHGDSRRHRNRQYSSYPVYSMQQEYIDPSYSYMGY